MKTLSLILLIVILAVTCKFRLSAGQDESDYDMRKPPRFGKRAQKSHFSQDLSYSPLSKDFRNRRFQNTEQSKLVEAFLQDKLQKMMKNLEDADSKVMQLEE